MSNIESVIYVARKLGHLRDRLVFVGGAVIELFLDDELILT